jgi:hypothetical protein
MVVSEIKIIQMSVCGCRQRLIYKLLLRKKSSFYKEKILTTSEVIY